MFFGIDPAEMVLLLVLGIVLFGPEKLPEFSRKAARLFVAVRDLANNAQTQLRSELGPEFSDLEIQDLNPKAFVKKHMSAEIAAIEEAKREIANAKKSVTETVDKATTELRDAQKVAQDAIGAPSGSTKKLEEVAFDPEAT